jgi:Ca-activated chloride channel family protein
VVLAIDVSGSMQGPPLDHVVASIERLVGLLEPGDRIGVVAFSDGASEVAPLLAATTETRRLVTSRVRRLVADGYTNVDAGLTLAASMMPKRSLHERQVILLLSDGIPNRGRSTAKDLADLSRSLRPDVGVSTLGYGPQHNEDVLRAISDAGAGRYHFISDPAVCTIELAQALGAQGDVVAEAIELSLAPEPGVVIAGFTGSPEVRFSAGGLVVVVPDLLDGGKHLIVADVDLTTPREPSSWKVLSASLSYRRAGERELLTVEETLSTHVGAGARHVVPEARASVLQVRADAVRAEARGLADRGQFEGAAAVLRRFIAEVNAEPWFKAGDGSPLDDAVEQLVDEAVAMERRPSQEQYSSFRKSQMMSSVAASQAAYGPRSMTARALAEVGGALPPAHLIFVKEARRVRIDKPRMVIGRTASADLPVQDRNVSRRHAEVVAQGGKYYAVDMGSTSVTLVNGEPIGKPTVLSHGDVIKVGDVEIRYEEG